MHIETSSIQGSKIMRCDVSELKQFVLMNKKSGQLMTGVRINFLDKKDFDSELLSVVQKDIPFRIGMLVHDGWVLTGPDIISRCFFNNECEQWFDNLGEL